MYSVTNCSKLWRSEHSRSKNVVKPSDIPYSDPKQTLLLIQPYYKFTHMGLGGMQNLGAPTIHSATNRSRLGRREHIRGRNVTNIRYSIFHIPTLRKHYL